MAEDSSPESLLVAHLDHVRRVARFTARRVGLSVSEVADCIGWVELRLVEDDYAQLRKFRGESSFRTFATVVVSMLVRDYRTQIYGKWRPSSAALRLGPVAAWLERLLHRDGLTFEQAALVISSASDISPTIRDLRALQRQLPWRSPLRPAEVDVEAAVHHSAADRADTRVNANERQGTELRLAALLQGELNNLPIEDRVALQMEVVDGATVASIARALSLPQRPLYDHLKALRRTLRSRLESAGVSREEVREFLSGDDT